MGGFWKNITKHNNIFTLYNNFENRKSSQREITKIPIDHTSVKKMIVNEFVPNLNNHVQNLMILVHDFVPNLQPSVNDLVPLYLV